jgi:hypothetical protein
MKLEAEMPELTFHGLHYCDLCGEPLAPGETLCGMCRACRVTPRPRERAAREPRRKHGKQSAQSRWA